MTHAQEYSYKRYTVDDGLPTNAVYGGMQDSRGYIWFYTDKGIARFDGYGFKNYTMADGLPTNDIFNISEDKYDRLWLHSFAQELVLMDVERDSFILIGRQRNRQSRHLKIYSDGKNVWTGAPSFHAVDSANYYKKLLPKDSLLADKLSKTYSLEHFYQYKPGISIGFSNNSNLIYIDHIHEIVDSFSLLNSSSIDIQKLHRRNLKSYHAYQDNYYIRPANDSLIYIISPDKRLMTTLNLKKYFNDVPTFVRFYPNHENLQIQTNLGVLIIQKDNQVIDHFSPKLPADVHFDRVFKDREGNIWVTSLQKGVYMLTAQERNTLVAKMLNTKDMEVSCLSLSNERLYFGTKAGYIFGTNTNDLKPQALYDKKASAKYDNITTIKSISIVKDFLWFIKQSDGVMQIDLSNKAVSSLEEVMNYKYNIDYKNIPNYNTPGTPAIKHISNLGKDLIWLEDKNQLLVARGYYPYLCTFSRDSSDIQLLTYHRTYSISIDTTQTIWLGHNDGLGSFKNGSYTFHDEIGQLNGKNIWDLEVSKNNILWVGTDGNGLVVFDGKNAFNIAGTENDIVQDIFISEDGYIWIATNYGVKQIEQNKVLHQSTVVNTYNVNSGLITREANCVAADNQYIFVGTNEGLTRINRQMAHHDSTAPVLYFDQIFINGDKTEKNSIYHLTYEQNELEFFFTALSYKSFGNIQYDYQLIGADRSIITTTNRSARYSNLAPGTYTFNLIATDIQGNKSQALNPVKIIISPPWWQTNFFYAVLILVVTAIIISIYLWRVRSIEKKAEWETNINRQFAVLELQALQAQMNPHFVFNSLGAIQYFIQTNKKELADDYLAQFGHLMRLFLESSKNKYIRLSEEIKLLSLYIRLEKIRFKQKFDYHLTVAEDINIHNTFLPSMLLQPFVENAINHGLFHKDGEGFLNISIKKEDNGALKCVIEDNGIGRKKAGEIRQQSNKNYKSRATKITEERLNALRKIEDFDIQLEIKDLLDQYQKALGTRVIITIPEID
ncbi:MAG: histidine kinase [Chitinophagales bacterium]|nr:histidine kinase [Chitinophagales bacterium]